MKIKPFIFIALVFVVACQPKPKLEDFAHFQAVITELDRQFIKHSEGSFEKRVTQEIRIQHDGMIAQEVWQHLLSFNSTFDSLVIHETSITEPEKEKQLLSPPPAAKSPDLINKGIFSSIQEQALFDAIEPPINSIFRIDYSLFTSTDGQPALMGHETIRQAFPVLKNTLSVKLPKDEPLSHYTLFSDQEPKIRKKGDDRTYTWKFGQTNSYRMEPNSPIIDPLLGRLIFSSSDSLFPLFNEFTFETTVPMREHIGDIIAGHTKNLTRLGSLQQWIHAEIELIELPTRLTGYQLRTAAEVWESGYGTQAEQCILLTAMIRSLGWKATPVATIPAALVENEGTGPLPGNLDLFPVSLVKVPFEGKNYYLNPSQQTTVDMANLYTDHYLVPFEMGYGQVNASYKDAEQVQFSWDGSINLLSNGELKGQLDGNYIGIINPYLGLRLDPTLADTFYESTGSRIELLNPNGSLIRYFYEKALRPHQLGHFTMDVPMGSGGIEGWNLDYSLGSRQSVLELPGELRELQRIVINLPNNYYFQGPSADLKEENALGRVAIRHTVSEGKVEIMRHLSINKKRIEPGDYQDLLLLLHNWFDADLRTLEFGKVR